MNEIARVATNGSWVRMIVKISAGSSGARRPQSPERARWAVVPGCRRLLLGVRYRLRRSSDSSCLVSCQVLSLPAAPSAAHEPSRDW